MAGCVSCFIIPLLLFLFHRFIQPIILRFWNPWETKPVTAGPTPEWNGWACPMKKKPLTEGQQEQSVANGEVKDNKANETQECLVGSEKPGLGEEACKLKSH